MSADQTQAIKPGDERGTPDEHVRLSAHPRAQASIKRAKAFGGLIGFLIGFWIIEAADLDVALKLAAQGSKACNRKVEVRPFLAQ